MGNGIKISIFNQNWILGVTHSHLVRTVNNQHLEYVIDLINEETRS